MLWSETVSSGGVGQGLGSGWLRASCRDRTRQRVGHHETGFGDTLTPSLCSDSTCLHHQGITGPEPARRLLSHGSHGSNPAKGCAGPNHSIIYHWRCSAGDSGKAAGEGTDPSSRSSVRFSWQGSTGGREPSLRTRGVRHHHHINNERAAPSKLFAPALKRAQNAEEVREPHPKQPWGGGRALRYPASHSSAVPLTWGDKTMPGPSPVTLRSVSLAAGWFQRGVSPSSCPRHQPLQAAPSSRPAGKGQFGCLSCKDRAFCPSFSDTTRCVRAFPFQGGIDSSDNETNYVQRGLGLQPKVGPWQQLPGHLFCSSLCKTFGFLKNLL